MATAAAAVIASAVIVDTAATAYSVVSSIATAAALTSGTGVAFNLLRGAWLSHQCLECCYQIIIIIIIIVIQSGFPILR